MHQNARWDKVGCQKSDQGDSSSPLQKQLARMSLLSLFEPFRFLLLSKTLSLSLASSPPPTSGSHILGPSQEKEAEAERKETKEGRKATKRRLRITAQQGNKNRKQALVDRRDEEKGHADGSRTQRTLLGRTSQDAFGQKQMKCFFFCH